jgi:membrane protease subunit HflC
MTRIPLAAVAVAGFVVLILLYNMFFVVHQYSQALVLRFGEPIRVENPWNAAEQNPGLKLKLPWDQKLIFSRKLLELNYPGQEIIAADQERLLVDAFARYRITDPLLFYQAVQNVERAQLQMQGYLDASLRRILGGQASGDIISGERGELMGAVSAEVNAQASQDRLGVEIVDVRIRQADLPEQNAERVYTRMETERQQRAAEIRANGEEAARRIRAEADRDVTVLLAEAREQAQTLMGEGDALRSAIYADAYTRNPEFFSFYRSMQAYETAIDEGTTIVLSPDSDFFRYFSSQSGGGQ